MANRIPQETYNSTMGDVSMDFTATSSWRPTKRMDAMAYIAAHRLNRDSQSRRYDVLDPVMGAGAFLSLLTVRLNPSVDVQLHGVEAAHDLYFQAITNVTQALTRSGRGWETVNLQCTNLQSALARDSAYDVVSFTPKHGTVAAKDETLRTVLPRFPTLLAAGGVALMNMPTEEVPHKETMAVVEETFAGHAHTVHHIAIEANDRIARGLAVEMTIVPPTLNRVTHSPYVDGMVLMETPLPDGYTPYFNGYYS